MTAPEYQPGTDLGPICLEGKSKGLVPELRVPGKQLFFFDCLSTGRVRGGY